MEEEGNICFKVAHYIYGYFWIEPIFATYLFHLFYIFTFTLGQLFKVKAQPEIRCSKLTIETLEQGLKCVQS